MNRFWSHFIAVAAGVMLPLFPAMQVSAQSSQSTRTPVLVELFTSEGCSSCPPADALLIKFQQDQPIPGAQIIVLEEHVDYWEGLGWHDRFSSHQFTDRQNVYGTRFKLESVYTPQMVVDGTEQFVGNDAAKARNAIAHAAQTPKTDLRLSAISADRRHVSGTVSIAGSSVGLPKADLFAALVDPQAETNVRGGENGGRQLHHAGVVRSLVRIGSMQDLAAGPVKFSLTPPADAIPGKEKVVVFAQRSGQGAVVAAVLSPIQPATGQPSVASR
jgi:hypothetical protein